MRHPICPDCGANVTGTVCADCGLVFAQPERDPFAEALKEAQQGVANTVCNYEDELRLFLKFRSPDTETLAQTREAIRDVLVEMDRWKDASEAFLKSLSKGG